jgi:hypothetical protein
MKNCDIKGCQEFISETLSTESERNRWVEIRACRCGAYNLNEPRPCICSALGESIPTSYWPNLDWWALGGVEKVTLCPTHRAEVFDEILRQRALDPSMNSERQNRGNVH